MDGDDDLFAVFDADENAEANQSKPTPSGQTDGASLVAEICGTKRQLSVKDEEEEKEGEIKKLKKEEEQLVMTGLSDVQIKERMGEVVGEPKDEDLGQVDREAMAEYQRARDKEEDTSVTSLVEAAPRIKVSSSFCSPIISPFFRFTLLRLQSLVLMRWLSLLGLSSLD